MITKSVLSPIQGFLVAHNDFPGVLGLRPEGTPTVDVLLPFKKAKAYIGVGNDRQCHLYSVAVDSLGNDQVSAEGYDLTTPCPVTYDLNSPLYQPFCLGYADTVSCNGCSGKK